MSLSRNLSIEAYAEAAMDHAAATLQGDHRRANRAHDVIAAIYRARRNNGTRAELLPLLEHPEPGVRAWAASHALEFASALAVPVLEELATDASLLGFSARMTLSEYRAGRLRFP